MTNTLKHPHVGDRVLFNAHSFQFIAIDGPKVLKAGVEWGKTQRLSDLEFTFNVLASGLRLAKRVDYNFGTSKPFVSSFLIRTVMSRGCPKNSGPTTTCSPPSTRAR